MAKLVTRVLLAAAEVAPFAKAGGLADVAGDLPKALAQLGVDVRVVIPKYSAIDGARHGLTDTGHRFRVDFDGIPHTVRVWTTTLPGSAVPVYLLDHPHYEGTGDIYYQDVTNPAEQQLLQVERFLFFSRCIRPLLAALAWEPQVVHCNDWHTGAIPALLRTTPIASVYTIHNLALQGSIMLPRAAALLQFPVHALRGLLHKDGDGGHVNLAALGIHLADAVNTVSPSYAEEIATPAFGAGLEGILASVPGGVAGILNGIDTERFDPAHDAALAAPYDADNLSGKAKNRQRLCAEFGITVEGPVFGMVTRLTDQKGVDVVCEIAPRLVELGCGLVMVGTGDAHLEDLLRSLAARYPAAIRAHIGFDAARAQRVYAGADFFLMPSRFEPCGLGQLIALRYGTVPVVHATGGLKDTVTEGANGNGFVCTVLTSDALLAACRRALETYRDHDRMRTLITRGMRQDVSWTASAPHYQRIYTLASQHHAATQRTS